MTRENSEQKDSTRPRGGQIWRRKADGQEVRIEQRRTINPMAGVRNHSGMQWSMVMFGNEGYGGCKHEADFVQEHEFVRAR